ncbi:MAG: SDR family NAD(P)-dependent oxidoreductase [Maritimibacter sp.]|nr:SDR family NAD(P)-dependent oxidoreductase [Maritimibacter sp.]
MSSWIILGATSSMARAFARNRAEAGETVFVAGRDMDDLAGLATDLEARGAPRAQAIAFDALDPASFAPAIAALEATEGKVNAAVFVGLMPSQAEIDADPALIDRVSQANYAGPARFLHELAPLIEARGGTVVGVTSVAGDRGRFSNYVYGSAKAGFATYLSGLRNRLNRKGAHVVTVKPGFVDTSMTWGVEGMFLVAAPADVASSIAKAVEKKKNVIYTPGFWWLIMTIIKLVPERIFKKLSF